MRFRRGSALMRVTIFDYGAGNLHSLSKAIAGPNVGVFFETDPLRSLDTDVLLLPGVGAFSHAAERLAPAAVAMREALVGGLPAIGICLGMQLLLDGSDEGDGCGIGVIPGRVTRLAAARIPQIGWNSLDQSTDGTLQSSRLTTAYYANSYVCRPRDESVVTAWTTHEGDRFPAIIRVGATVGVQFHPEKSSAAGVRFLRALVEEAGR